MELKDIKVKEITDLNLTYPNGEETGVVFKVQGTNEPSVRRILKKWDTIGSRSRKGLTFEQKEEASVELLKAAVVDWEGLEEDGEPLECTDENKSKILKDKNLRFIRDQVDEFIGDANNFFSKTETT